GLFPPDRAGFAPRQAQKWRPGIAPGPPFPYRNRVLAQNERMMHCSRGEEGMRKILTFLPFGACAVAGRAQSSAVVEQKTVPAVSNTCGPVADLLTESGRQGVGRLFIRDAGQWHEADYSWWNGASYSLSKYRGEQLAFIYAVPPSPPDIRQFLSIRTTNY